MSADRPIIVGGGIAGLAAAYEFSRAGARAVLLDDRPAPGGVIRTGVVEGCVLEDGPDSFLTIKPAALQLIREVGLGDDVIASNDRERVTYIVRGGRLVPMPDGLMMMVPTRILPVAQSPLLGWGTKLRMGLEYFRRPPGAPVSDETVASFIRRHYGQETVDYLAEPLLAGVYGGTADQLSVQSVLPRFAEMETKFGSLTRGVLAARRARQGESGPLFQTLKGGLQQLVDRLAPHADFVSARVETVERAGDLWRVKAAGDWIETRRLVLAVPAWSAAALLQDVDPALAGLLAQVPYSSSLTLSLGYRKSDCGPVPPGHGILVPRPEGATMLACTFVQSKFLHRVADDKLVFRCFLGGAGNEAVLDRGDDDLIKTVQQELQRLLGWRATPVFTRIARWRRSMAQYTVGHGARLKAVRARLESWPTLALAGNAYDGIGIPDCIRLGREAARKLAGAPQAS